MFFVVVAVVSVGDVVVDAVVVVVGVVVGAAAAAVVLVGVIVGPAFAGGLIAFFSLEVTFLIAALTYVPLIPVLIYMPLRTRIKKGVLQGNFFHRFLEGGKFALRTPIILRSLFVVFVSAFFVRGMLEIQPTPIFCIQSPKRETVLLKKYKLNDLFYNAFMN